ncbi:MAG: hypothetical protein WD646_08640 [Actinomycetota bacterium]
MPTPTPTPTATPVPENCTPEEGERIVGERKIQFAVNSPGHDIQYVRMYLLAGEKAVKDARAGQPVFCRPTSCGVYAEEDAPTGLKVYDYAWDSVNTTPLNGNYKMRVEASAIRCTTLGGCGHAGSPEETQAERVNLLVDNPPLAVGAPSIVATTTESVTIKWPAAKEADVQSYTVYRAVTKDASKAPKLKDLKPLDVVTTTEYRDTKPGGDVNWYAVEVTRRSIVTPEDGISSPLSKLSPDANVRTAPAPSEVPASRNITPFRQLSTVRGSGRPPPVPDAPYSAYLPYERAPSSSGDGVDEPGGDPRGPVLPVAVGAFLVSSALALGRMPY